MGYKILSQGVLDGTCFMYSIMNAYKTLFYPDLDIRDFKHRKPDEISGKQKWANILSIYPRANEMLASHQFEEYFGNKAFQNSQKIISTGFDHLLYTAFYILSEKDRSVSVQKLNFPSIRTFDFSESVIVLNIAHKIKASAGNFIDMHFVCINGRTDENLHLACFYSIHQIEPNMYKEHFDSKTKRYYNNSININDLTEDIIDMGMNEIYNISKVD